MYHHIAALATRSCRPTCAIINVKVSYIPNASLRPSFNRYNAHVRKVSSRFSALPSACSIRHGEVHLWWMSRSSDAFEESYGSCRDLLDPVEEVGRLDKALESGRQTEVDGLVARAYLRHVLSQYTGGSPGPQEIAFRRNEYGKPELVNQAARDITFNMTHSRGVVGVAVSRGHMVGLDVEAKERTTKKIDEMKLAKRYFSENEIQMLADLPPGEPRQLFFLQLWTLKESYVKALGRGIGASPGLRSFGFNVYMADKSIEFLPSEKEPHLNSPWSFTLLEPLPGYIGDVCNGPCINMSMYVSPSLTSYKSIDAIRHARVEIPVLASSL